MPPPPPRPRRAGPRPPSHLSGLPLPREGPSEKNTRVPGGREGRGAQGACASGGGSGTRPKQGLGLRPAGGACLFAQPVGRAAEPLLFSVWPARGSSPACTPPTLQRRNPAPSPQRTHVTVGLARCPQANAEECWWGLPGTDTATHALSPAEAPRAP